jgi:hypothetical protein
MVKNCYVSYLNIDGFDETIAKQMKNNDYGAAWSL